MSHLGRLCQRLACIITMLVPIGAAHAAYPDRPVHLVLGFAAGGGTDTLARLFAAGLSQKWGQQVLVENRTGAEGTIAENYVARSSADGYTLILVPNSHTISAAKMTLSYDPVKDFTPVTLLVEAPDLVVINPNVLPVSTLAEFIAQAKANPGKITFGSPGESSPNYVEMAVLMSRTDIKLLHVPYANGTSAIVTALLGGEIQAMFGSASAIGEQIKAGKVRAIASGGKNRSRSFPNVPTVAESGNLPGFDEAIWDGILVPAGTPKDIVAKLHGDFVEQLNTNEMKEKLIAQGFSPVGSTPDEFDAFLKKELQKLKDLVKSLDVKK